MTSAHRMTPSDDSVRPVRTREVKTPACEADCLFMGLICLCPSIRHSCREWTSPAPFFSSQRKKFLRLLRLDLRKRLARWRIVRRDLKNAPQLGPGAVAISIAREREPEVRSRDNPFRFGLR